MGGGIEEMLRQNPGMTFLPTWASHQQKRRTSEFVLPLMRPLVAYIRKETLTQAEAAKLLRVTQPRVSELISDKIHLFSIDSLVVLLAAAGLRVDLKIKTAA